MKRLLVWLLAVLAWCAVAQGVQPVPALTAHVIDQTGTLDAIQAKGLDDKLLAYERTKGTQIAVLMVATTQPEDIASYANRVGNAWKIGRKGVGDGVLVVVAKNDRKVRIEVAKSLEGAIPDLAAQGIIDQAITPNFKKGDFAAGLQGAADMIIARVNGEALPEPKQSPSASGSGILKGFDWMDTAIFLFFAVPIVGGILRGILGSKLGALATGAGVGTIALLVTSSIVIAAVAALVALVFSLFSGGFGGIPTGGSSRRSGRSGGGWSTGGGGGGWSSGSSSGDSWGGSGGGGDFGGGGASGDW
ncbi:MAG: TPM domain-containing protein [Ramlibacter sp.]